MQDDCAAARPGLRKVNGVEAREGML
jgi:hypothetical protein